MLNSNHIVIDAPIRRWSPTTRTPRRIPAGPDAFFLGLLETRNEAEADAFAAVALVPRPALASYDWLEENPGPDALRIWQRRARLFETYGI